VKGRINPRLEGSQKRKELRNSGLINLKTAEKYLDYGYAEEIGNIQNRTPLPHLIPLFLWVESDGESSLMNTRTNTNERAFRHRADVQT
jgi:hypothetical protein